MKGNLLVALCVMAWAPMALAAWDWPLARFELGMDFATDYQGSFLGGVMLRSADPAVKAVHAGQVVLVAKAERRLRDRFPLGFGGTVILQHPKGLRSVYTGLEQLSLDNTREVVGGQEIGKLGMQENGTPNYLFFRILDNTWQGSINPLVILPRIHDERLPVISAVQVEPAGGTQRVTLSDRMEMTAGSFRLFVQTHDNAGVRNAGAERAFVSAPSLPQDIRVILNGVLVYSSSKLAIRAQDGSSGRMRLVSNRMGDYAAMYQGDGAVAMGELVLADGLNRLEIRASDLDGNRTSASYRIIHPVRPAQP